MDDFGSGVVRSAYEVGTWRGPARRPWLQRIVTGAGFSRDWNETRLIGNPPHEPEPVVATSDQAPAHVPTPPALTAESLRLWWLPSAREP